MFNCMMCRGQKLGKFQELPNKLSENSHLVLFHDKATCTVGFIERSLSSFITGDKARAETETNFEILTLEIPGSEKDCEDAILCIVDIFAGVLIPGIGICSGERTCKKICKMTKKAIRDLVKEEALINKACGAAAAIVQAIITEGTSLLIAVPVLIDGCFLGCNTPSKHNSNKFCDDLSKAKKDLSKLVCDLGVVAPEDTSIEQGLANNVGEVNDTGLILISGEFKFDGDINFEDSMIIIDDLLNEIDGAGELTELTLDENNSEDDANIILPVILPFTPEANSEANNDSQQRMKTFASPDLPLFQMTIEEVDEINGVFEFNLVADRLVIPKVPVLCAGIPSETELTTSFVISDGNTPLEISANGIWLCSGAVPLELTLGMRTNSEGGGCSIANQGAPMSIPLYLFVLIVPVFCRFRRKVRF